jgi:Domain of unknown function (DUF4252)
MKITLKTLLLSSLTLFAPMLFAQDFDFKTLDKIGVNAKSSTNVTLDGDMLKMAAGFLGGNSDKDTDSVKSMVQGLKSIYVRSWEFDKPGQYAEADLAPLRAYLKQPKWKAIVDVKEEKESTQVYFLSAANNKLGGMAVVSSEPTEVTVVYIDGELNIADLQKLGGSMGIPDLKGLTGGKSSDSKNDKKTDNKGK